MPPEKKDANKRAKKQIATASEAANDILEEAYDDFPYESYVYPQTHPERMYTVGKLFRLAPPDIATARILEIGCATGGNIIPLAMLYPNTKCVGIDLSREQIAAAEKDRAAMNVKNLKFLQRDITKLEKDFGEFDYIICHGVLSWTPASVHDSVFEVCRRHLAKNGMAVISYNTLPGWSAVKSLRDMMIYHVKIFETPAQKIHEARSLLNFLYENVPPGNETYRQVIDRERTLLNSTNDSYIFHDHLEKENHQFYLHQFAEMADKHDLTYVGDVELSSMYTGNYSANVQKTLSEIPEIVRQEQYIDFLLNRRFRHSIITRKENETKIFRNVDSSMTFDFDFYPRFRAADAEPDAEGKMKFVLLVNEASSFSTPNRETSLAFKALAEKTRPVNLNELAIELQKKTGLDPELVRDAFARNALPLMFQGFIGLHSATSRFADTPGEKPKAWTWARYLAPRKGTHPVANLRLETIHLVPFEKTLLPHLDGTNDRGALIDKMAEHVLKGDIKLHKENRKVTEVKEIREIIGPQLEATLEKFAKLALLEA